MNSERFVDELITLVEVRTVRVLDSSLDSLERKATSLTACRPLYCFGLARFVCQCASISFSLAQDAALSLPLVRYRYICHVPSTRLSSLAPRNMVWR